MDTGDARQAGFNPANFRDAIKFAMKMGAPNPADNRATFQWDTERSYDIEDPNGNPYSWDKVPEEEVSYSDVQVDVAVEFIARSTLSGITPIGEFDTPRAVLTILDVDWAIVLETDTATPRPNPDRVLLGGNTYKLNYVAPDIGLFDVNVYQVHCSAIDES